MAFSCAHFPFALLFALPACTVRDPSDSDSGTGTFGSTSTADTSGDPSTPTTGTAPTGTTTTGTTTADATTAPDDTGFVTTGASDSTSDASTGDDLDCSLADPAGFKFELDPAPDDFMDLVFEWDCEVLDAITTADGATIGLDCTADGMKVDPPPRVILTASPPPPTIALAPGQLVHVRYEQAVPWWTERALRIDDGDTILLAGVSGSGLVDAFAGVGLAPLDPVCPAQDDGCGLVDHEGLHVTVGDASGDVHSRNFTAFGAYGVWAPELTHYVDGPLCTDTPDSWRSLDLLRLIP